MAEASATGYGNPQLILLIDAVAMEIALRQAVIDFPGAEVTAMPHNNPGFDILVSQTGATNTSRSREPPVLDRAS